MTQGQTIPLPILVLPGRQISPRVGATFTQQGSTAHFTVYYETSLGNNGATLADAVLATCEKDYSTLQGYFGGTTPARLPFNVYIQTGSSGGGHGTCNDTTLRCDAFSGTNADLERFVVVAEADEVFMAAQGAGWDCFASNGEGLSRILATELYPAQLGQFATGASWLDSTRPDWVTNNDLNAGTNTGYNPVAIGCSTLFINYLHYQLHYSWAQIIQAGGATLAQTYTRLTGATDAFARFSSLMNNHFPPGQPSGLTNDNPFPLF